MDNKITFIVDGESKKEFSDLCDALGLTMSSALLMFVRQCVIKKGIPFDIDTSPEKACPVSSKPGSPKPSRKP